jgi:L,D-peptidoglycan transpeptidase YkuD (ErfK/YbiS/YcfS/YnhG family)
MAGGLTLPCALGRAGISPDKREGDGATPAGAMRPLQVLFRPDRERRPVTGLPVAPIRPDDGWCDDPEDRNYNLPVRLPYPGRHERMWRDDGLYDLVVVLDWNLPLPRRGKGSAIFLHVARPGFLPTEGCVALELPALRQIMARLGPETVFEVRS